MRDGRRAFVRLEYDGVSIDLEVGKDLVSFSYTDNSDKADEITFTVQDKEGNWSGPWWPQPRAAQG